ncbi:MAG: transcriptional regulator GcvA [Desulfobacter sp.]|nr:MAG: transcriptional regulator GcvA [Desulfobacter sp.]
MHNKKTVPLPSLNALRAFEAAARHESFTRAAKELSVTQGAISRQVKQLETQLDVILFHRRHKHLTLTDQGMLLLSPLTQAFSIMSRAVEKLKNQSQDLNLKVHPTFAIRWLIPRLHIFQALYPDIRVRLTTSGINADFKHENFDAGITHLGNEIPGVVRKKILKEQLVPVCSPDLAKGAPPIKKPKDLCYRTLLHNSPDLKEWQTWADQKGVNGLFLEHGQVFEVDDAALQAATSGLGVVLGDIFLIKEELDSGRLVAPLGLEPIQTGNYYFSRPEFNREAKGVNLFWGWLKTTLDLKPVDPNKKA